MRKIIILLMMFTMSIFLVACGSASPDESDTTDQPIVEDNEVNSGDAVDETEEEIGNESESNDTIDEEQSDVNGDEATKVDGIDYVEFELEVEYPDGKEYEVELEKKRNDSYEAQIQDELNGIQLKGSEAFDQLYPLVEQLTITQSTSKSEAIQEVLKVFQLDGNYEEFELEITFKDGTEIEFQDEK